MGAALYPVAARPIPGPLVADLASGSEMARICELVAENGRLRELVDSLTGKTEPPMPHGWTGFVFAVDVDQTHIWCLAHLEDSGERFNHRFYVPKCPEVIKLWINGQWLDVADFAGGPLESSELDSAAESYLKSEWQASCDRMAEERAYYRGLGV